MRILVTGGAGFIGSHLVDAYSKAGHQLLVIDNLSSGNRQFLPSQVDFRPLDINSSQTAQLIQDFKPEIINHHAAQINVRSSVEDPRFDAQTNILGFINLLEAARQTKSVKKVIFASTGGAIYGNSQVIPTPETEPVAPLAPYGISKRAGELYLHFYHQVHQIPFTVLRYSNVYGPRQNPHGEAGVVAIYYQRFFTHQDFIINGDGQQTRDFIFVSDVVSANLTATQKAVTGIFNIATSQETSVNQLVELMQQSVNDHQTPQHGPAKDGEVQRSCLAITKAQKELGWSPQVHLEDGLKQTADFFSSNS